MVRRMKSNWLLFLIPLLMLPRAAYAEEADGSAALALAALAGNVSPLLGEQEKNVLMGLLDGQEKLSFPAGKTITIEATTLTCRASDVDLTSRSCALKFGNQDVALTGRAAHELFATLAEIGVPPDGAAGSIFETVSALRCTVDPDEVKQNAGGGAHCEYGPPN
jgi:hypothetical protein